MMRALEFGLTEEQRMVQESIAGMLQSFDGRRREFEQAAEEGYVPEDLWTALARAGLLGAFIPKEYGGTGLGLLALATASETIARHGFRHPLFFLTGMDALCLVRSGSAELKARFLPRIARGELKFCFAITEAGAGTNSFRMTTRPVRDGDSYVIDGEKTFITGIDRADYVLLVVRTRSQEDAEAVGQPRSACLSVFVVDTRTPGIEYTRLPIRVIDGAWQFTVHFDGVRVPAANLVGAEHEGARVMFNTLNPERVLAAADACGQAMWLLERAVRYARERVVFGPRPIGTYQAIQHPLAEIRIKLEAARTLAYRAAAAFDAGVEPAEAGAYANMAKYLAAEVAIEAADRAIQTHGGAGFSQDVGIIGY